MFEKNNFETKKIFYLFDAIVVNSIVLSLN